MNKNNSGFIIINKPAGPTSHDIINKLRKIIGITRPPRFSRASARRSGREKIGHAGTLDPFASGVLIVAIGREATREINKFVKMDKEYVATLCLGAVTDTFDRTGKIKNQELRIMNYDLGKIKEVIKNYVGTQKQIPPMYSAKKVKGKKLYELARKGIEIERKPAEIEIYDLRIMKYEWPILKIKCRVSSGTYIRTLANDIGEKLGCGAYLEELVRTAVGDYRIDDAINIEDINENNWDKLIFVNFIN